MATAVYLIIPCKQYKIATVSRAQKDRKPDRWDTNVDSCISLELVGLAKGRVGGVQPTALSRSGQQRSRATDLVSMLVPRGAFHHHS